VGGHELLLWARDAQQAHILASTRANPRYLPQALLPESVAVTADPQAAVQHAVNGLALIATPMAGLRAMLQITRGPTVWVCKGFEAGTGLLGHEIAQQLAVKHPVGVLSGPSFAQEVAQARPTALVMASSDADLREAAVQALHGGALRVYAGADPIGVEVGGAVKNVLAIATGLCDGLKLGLNARAALITRGLAEMTRLGVTLGARADTFMGLSGLGDLVLTATGELSRNRQVGLRLAQGQRLDAALESLGHVAEGVHTAPVVWARAQALKVAMPITEAVVGVLQGQATALQALDNLMRRDPGVETLQQPPA
jgi:glycerol-3-phosphate dehydrogenase (NAD(P)+)